ncbi:MAG: hypothetical protein ACP5O6_12810 [Candidatus Baltobacteraceae bacterium]
MDVTALDGRAFAKFIAAGSYFLKKYRGVLNDLNVFPVPDGDTGTNMFLTVRSAGIAAAKCAHAPLSAVAAAAARRRSRSAARPPVGRADSAAATAAAATVAAG